MSDETTIKVGNTVQVTRDLRSIHPDKPILLAGSIGTVTGISGSYARVEFDFGIDTLTKVIPLESLDLLDRPIDLAFDWNLIANMQRDPVSIAMITQQHMIARFYDPRRENETSLML